MSDSEILSLLKDQQEKSSNRAFRAIYQQVFPMIRKMVFDSGGTEEQALDVFQDMSLIFFKNVTSGKYQQKSKISTYLYSIARNHWYVQLKKEKRIPMGGTIEDMDVRQITEEENAELDMVKLVEKFFTKLDEGCQRLLRMYYYESKNMKQIMAAFSLGSEQAAKTKKFRCMKKLEGLFAAHQIKKGSFNL